MGIPVQADTGRQSPASSLHLELGLWLSVGPQVSEDPLVLFIGGMSHY